MKNTISIVEIPTQDFQRAITFYQSVLEVNLEQVQMGDVCMALFPNDGNPPFVSLVNGADYKPSPDGAVVYLNAGEDLQPVLKRIERHGGTTIVSKTEIAPDMGHYALFMDTEGNRFGLHSVK